jgi:hypothetical protein
MIGLKSGTEPTAFAGKGNEVFVAASVALHADKAIFQPAAAQIVLELGQHKAWQRVLVPLEIIPQGWQMLFDDGIERRVLWLMASVMVTSAEFEVAGNRFHRVMMAGWGQPIFVVFNQDRCRMWSRRP